MSRLPAPVDQPEHENLWTNARWRGNFRRRLLDWFTHNQRDLPWRRSRDPYAIWISEIMLQQTQVATVVPYYERFLQRFPDIATLAAADGEEVLRYWEGLGYYRRARQMHAAAVRVTEAHGGVFPDRLEDVLSLPGIGRYTAGAILSISADRRLPIIEANTIRLYSRLIALRRPPAQTASMRLLWETAQAVLPRTGCGRFNQAAMELGSLVCLPREPLCDSCPLGTLCSTRKLGLQHEIPGAVKKMVYEQRSHWAVVVSEDDRFFLRLCPPGGHWAGLWDFPRYDVTGQEHPAAYVERRFEDEFGWPIRWGDHLRRLRHGVTRFRITLDAHRATPRTASGTDPGATSVGERRSLTSGWFTSSEMARMPLNTSGRKLARIADGP